MSDIIIIGSGPAGVSASLYTIRAGIAATVISNGSGALQKSDEIENYYGFPEPVSGRALEENGIRGAKRLGVNFLSEEVVDLGYEDKFVVKTNLNTYKADGVIIATGTSRQAPKIAGLAEFEGKGISYCAVCDGFFYRGKDVAVLGSGEFALHEANELSNVANSVTILTNGAEMSVEVPPEIKVNKQEIKQIKGDQRVSSVEFNDNSEIPVSGIFVAYGVAGSTALAKKIGALTKGSKIVVNENMETNIPGLYAAGDCTGGLLQISKAVYEGAKAGTEIVKYLRKNK